MKNVAPDKNNNNNNNGEKRGKKKGSIPLKDSGFMLSFMSTVTGFLDLPC